MSNNIKKNQNKINILESDVHALRERLGVQNEKMNSIDTYLNKDMLDKKNNSRDNSDPVDFSNFLERISAMNGNMMNDDEEYSEEDSSSDESSTEDNSSVEDMSNESSSEDEEDGSDVYETEEESANEEVSIDENVKSVSSEPEPEPEPKPEPEPEPVQEPVKEVEVPKKEEPSLGLDDLMDDKSSKKMPTASIKKLDLGTVMVGGDGKTKYVVALNKSGKKYWKRN